MGEYIALLLSPSPNPSHQGRGKTVVIPVVIANTITWKWSCGNSLFAGGLRILGIRPIEIFIFF